MNVKQIATSGLNFDLPCSSCDLGFCGGLYGYAFDKERSFKKTIALPCSRVVRRAVS
jgi:hypothetical protein